MRSLIFLSAVCLLHGQYRGPRILGKVAIEGLEESSGLTASQTYPGLLWTHNDDGDAVYLYAIDRSGKSRGRWLLSGVKLNDWEAISMGPRNTIYAGDIGDNRNNRTSIRILQFPEPDPSAAGGSITSVKSIELRYPDGPHDAEAMAVHPRTGEIYIVTKARGRDARTNVYKAKAAQSGTLQYISEVKLPDESAFTLLVGRITGADISPDGKRVILCDYFRGWEAELPEGVSEFDRIWKQKWNAVDLGTRPQGEAVCYRQDGRAILTTSEGRTFPLIEVERIR